MFLYTGVYKLYCSRGNWFRDMHTQLIALVCVVSETRLNKLVIPEGAAGVNYLLQIILLAEFSFTLNYCFERSGVI